MAKLKIEFEVFVPYEDARNNFAAAVAHWAKSHQMGTSALAQSFGSGNAFGGYRQKAAREMWATRAKGQGVEGQSPTQCKVQIPASMSTYGGEMAVQLEPGEGRRCRISIDGRTQGLLGGTLKDNVHGLRDYLVQALENARAANTSS
jgi:hypothetical protein